MENKLHFMNQNFNYVENMECTSPKSSKIQNEENVYGNFVIERKKENVETPNIKNEKMSK